MPCLPRLYDPERRPFWTTAQSGNVRYRVYFSNDRVFIYAIGYPTLTLFDHLVHLAELTTLSGAVYVLVLLGTALFTRVARGRPRLGRALLREIRASFYRKLFLAFVLASIIPVLALALWIRTYFANLLTADVAREAARTAAVAQRVIEQSNALLQRTDGLAPASDDVMVWIRQVIDQDVNIFKGAQLVATSERDLFESGVLAQRTPDAVYRAIVLEAPAELRRRGSDRQHPLHDRGDPRARGRAEDDPDRAARQPSARHRSRDRRSRSRRPPRGARVRAARRRRWASTWPNASRIRSAA